MNSKAVIRMAYNRMWRFTPLKPVRFEIINSLDVAGLYIPSRRVIQLSKEYMQAWEPEQVEQTILHELAHHMRGKQAKGEDHHDAKWFAVARSIGYRDGATINPDYPRPKIVWEGTCPFTGEIIETHTDPRESKEETYSCKLCKTNAHAIEWERLQIVKERLNLLEPEPSEFLNLALAIRRKREALNS
jgi:predicted SprT family Zn-dependent metalloprotease